VPRPQQVERGAELRHGLARVRRPEPAARVERPDRRQRLVVDAALPVRRALQRVVVEEDGNAVRRHLEVELHRIGPGLDGGGQGRQRVLRRPGAEAAVRDDLCGAIEGEAAHRAMNPGEALTP
jgi:hypothetical protein